MNKQKLIDDLEKLIDRLEEGLSLSGDRQIKYMGKDEIFNYIYCYAERTALHIIESNVKDGKYD